MTPAEKYEKLKAIQADYHKKMDALRRDYRAKFKVLLSQINDRKIAEIKEHLYK